MRLKYFIATSVAVAVAATSAQAADLVRTKMGVPVSPLKVYSNLQEFSWDGAYVGVLGEFSHSSTAAQTIDVLFSQEKKDKKGEFSKGVQSFVGNKSSQNHYNVGLVGGYNFSLANGFVVGVELDAVYTAKSGKVKREKGDAVEGKTVLESTEEFFDVPSDAFIKSGDEAGKDEKLTNITPVLIAANVRAFDKQSTPLFTGSLNARAGYAVGNVLPFVTAGVKANYLSETTKGVKAYNTTAPAVKKDGKDPEYDKAVEAKKFTLGWTAGLGVDYAVTKNVVLRAEYRFSNILSKSKDREYDYQVAENSDNKPQDFKVTYTDGAGYKASHEVRVGVAYKF